jgi:hypothetical protein
VVTTSIGRYDADREEWPSEKRHLVVGEAREGSKIVMAEGFVNPGGSTGPVEVGADGAEQIRFPEGLEQECQVGADELDFSQLGRESGHENHR